MGAGRVLPAVKDAFIVGVLPHEGIVGGLPHEGLCGWQWSGGSDLGHADVQSPMTRWGGRGVCTWGQGDDCHGS